MNRTRATTALLLATTLLTACSSQPTYDESVQQCMKALKARTKPSPIRPKPCEPLKDSDYTLVVGNQAMADLGWTDENGNFDQNRMLQSSPRP